MLILQRLNLIQVKPIHIMFVVTYSSLGDKKHSTEKYRQ